MKIQNYFMLLKNILLQIRQYSIESHGKKKKLILRDLKSSSISRILLRVCKHFFKSIEGWCDLSYYK